MLYSGVVVVHVTASIEHKVESLDSRPSHRREAECVVSIGAAFFCGDILTGSRFGS